MVKRIPAVNEQLYTGFAVFSTQPGMVCRTFVAEMLVIGQVSMVSEVFVIIEGCLQNSTGNCRFKGTVELIGQIGRGKMNSAVQRVSTG